VAKAYWSQVAVGDLIGALIKPALSRVQIAKFAAAAQDYSPLHIDDEYAKAEGFGSVFAHGLLVFGFIEEALVEFGDNMQITSINGTFHKLAWPGDLLTAKGLISNHYEKDGEHRIDLDVWVENQNQEIVLKGNATCVLEFDEHKKHKKG
jgi:acyl dehydratase